MGLKRRLNYEKMFEASVLHTESCEVFIYLHIRKLIIAVQNDSIITMSVSIQ